MGKMIIVDIMNETAEVKIETIGYKGPKCIEESQFLKDALGTEIEMDLKPTFYEREEEEIREYKLLCG